jgi:hypothetical protein
MIRDAMKVDRAVQRMDDYFRGVGREIEDEPE